MLNLWFSSVGISALTTRPLGVFIVYYNVYYLSANRIGLLDLMLQYCTHGIIVIIIITILYKKKVQLT